MGVRVNIQGEPALPCTSQDGQATDRLAHTHATWPNNYINSYATRGGGAITTLEQLKQSSSVLT